MNLRADGDALLIDILVQPRASRARIGPTRQERLVIAVTAPPVDGEANQAVVELVARALHIARGNVEVARGDTSRRKTLRIRGATVDQVAALAGPSGP